MASKGNHEDLVEALLVLGLGLSAFFLFSHVPLLNIINKLNIINVINKLNIINNLASVLLVGGVIIFITFVGSVYRKKMLIDAFAQQVTDEMSRMDINTPTDVAKNMSVTMERFAVEGLENMNKELRVLVEGDGRNDAEVLAGAAERVVNFRQAQFSSFLYQRTTLRWTIDGLEALIGDYKSIEVAWTKGTRYLGRFLKEEDRESRGLPWIASYMKLLGLPYNIHAKNFEEQAKKAMARQYPKGYFSLLIASQLFGYRSRLRIFNLTGEEAWREIIRFKADTLDFEYLKRTIPPRRP
jgi:hypothetical protein